MADILDILDQLEVDDKPKKQSNAKGRPAARTPSTKRESRPTSRPRSVPPPPRTPPSATLQPPPPLQAPTITPRTSSEYPERSRSQGADSRRISFAETRPPSTRRLWIPTKTDSLSSGFPFDIRLRKYGVTENEWHQFTSELVEAAQVPGPSWMWNLKKKDVIKRISRDLQYGDELSRILKAHNRAWRPRRFQAWLEPPSTKGLKDLGDFDTKEEKQQAERDAKRFRIVITPDTEKAGSVYSRSSSLTRSVTGEAAGLQNRLKAELAGEAARPGSADSALSAGVIAALGGPPSGPPKRHVETEAELGGRFPS